jgi:hypothetical protein
MWPISPQGYKENAMSEKPSLHNSKCAVEYDPERKQISGRDLTDRWNEPAFYSKTKRGIKNAWADLEACFSETTIAHDVMTFLEAYKIRTHYWCMVD